MRGHQVTAVSNGRQTLQERDSHVFDVVLMDIHMSELDGLAATAGIRRKEQGAPPVPIVALTADAGDGLRERYLALGFTDYIAKPVKPEALYALIEGLSKPAAVARKAVT
jgi:protein-histidine pros-kinase